MLGVDLDTMKQPAEPRIYFSHLPYDCVPKMIYCFGEQEDELYNVNTSRSSFSTNFFTNTAIDEMWRSWGHSNGVEWTVGLVHGSTAMMMMCCFLFFDDLREDHACWLCASYR